MLKEDETVSKEKTIIAVGIDLGTTNSCIAVCHGYKDVRVLPHHTVSSNLTPSCVSFEGGRIYVGEYALRATSRPENSSNTIFEIKRIIGRMFDDPEVALNQRRWPFCIRNGQHGPLVRITDTGALKKNYTPVEISSLVLADLKKSAETFFSGTPNIQLKAVITVPAKFNDKQRKATKEAAMLAGLDVIGMISEPTAAAIAYGVAETTDSTFMVFDFGGGTLDISVMRYTIGHPTRFQVLVTASDMRLGGADFDGRLLDLCVKRFLDRHGIDLRNDPHALGQILTSCEKAKTRLCQADSPHVRIAVRNIVRGVDFNEKITLAEFEDVCHDLYPRFLEPVTEALRMLPNLKKSDLNFVLVLGGSSRMAKVRQVLQAHFAEVPLKFDANPDQTIAKGAAIYAKNLLQTSAGEMATYDVSDITFFNLGVEIAGGKLDTVIPKGTRLPTRAGRCYTCVNGQEFATIRIFEGESERVSENQLLGELELQGLAGEQSDDFPIIVVVFSYDEFGLLEVSAYHDENGTRTEVKLYV